MNLTQTKTRNRFQVRLDELHFISIALYAEAITNPTDALVRRIEEIAIEREQVHKEWEASWQEPIAPSPETIATVTTAPAAIGESDEPPNREDNGHGRVQPTAAKKLMLSLVSVKHLVSDVPASNFDPNELEIAGELSLAIGGFTTPPVLKRDGDGFRVVSGHFQYHAAVLARRLNPKAGETIPAIVLEEENQAMALNQLKRLKFAA